MKTFLKKIKNIGFIVFALSLATVLFSFKLLENKSNTADEFVWFQADNTGNIGSYIVTADEPGGNCTNPSTTPLCAVGMDPALFPGSAPYSSPISNISDNPSLIKEERHREP